MKQSDTSLKFDRLIESKVGMTIKDIRSKSSEGILSHIEKRAGRKFDLGRTTRHLSYRGNMLLALGRITRDIDERFDSAFSIKK